MTRPDMPLAEPGHGAGLPLRVAGLAAAALALTSAAVTLYWTVGGTGLLDTVGGQFAELAGRGGPEAVTLGLAVVVVKVLGGLLALALVQPWGRRLPQRPLVALALSGAGVLVLYGGLLVVVGGLVLSGVVTPSSPVDERALRWHVLVWDMWFLLWGLTLGATALARHRQDADRRPSPP